MNGERAEALIVQTLFIRALAHDEESPILQ